MNSSRIDVAVVIPAHNPRRDYLGRVVDALRAQSLPQQRWELLVVDNRSDVPIQNWIDLRWHPNSAVVREGELGLARARVRGIKETASRLVIFVDDDNVLASDYLERVLGIAEEFPFLGTWSGHIEPDFERPETAPPRELYPLLTLREISADLWSNDPSHHASTPWGAGLCVRREVADAYLGEVDENPDRASLDLKGGTLLYGGDTDIAYTGCRMGLGKGVFSRLHLMHLIPTARCTSSHLCRVAQGKGYSEVLHGYVLASVLPENDRHGISWTLQYIRAALKPGIKRSVAFAHLKGRRRALRDLVAARAK